MKNENWIRYWKPLTDRIMPAYAPETGGLRYYQEFILQAILASTMGLGFLVMIPTLIFAAKQGRWQLAIVDAGVFLAGLFILFSRTLKYEIRAGCIIGLCYTLGVVIIVVRSIQQRADPVHEGGSAGKKESGGNFSSGSNPEAMRGQSLRIMNPSEFFIISSYSSASIYSFSTY